jgi:hypothetical protein
VTVLAVVLPIPLFAAFGLSLPLPTSVERLAAKLVPFGDDSLLGSGREGSLARGSIVLAATENGASERAASSSRPTGQKARDVETHSAGSDVAGPARTDAAPTPASAQDAVDKPGAGSGTADGTSPSSSSGEKSASIPGGGSDPAPPPAPTPTPAPSPSPPQVVSAVGNTANNAVSTVTTTATSAVSSTSDAAKGVVDTTTSTASGIVSGLPHHP